MLNYIEIETEDGKIIKREKDEVVSFIPIDNSNSDYQAYLRWLNGEDESATL